ncbi:MAG: hypothetical protein P1U37_08530 [Minwuia sp.]|nr:hypothetical protein [Minwuia sp.]
MASPNGFMKEMLRPRAYVTILVGIILLLSGILISKINHFSLEELKTESVSATWEVVSHLLIEVAFAMIIAVIIAVFFEESARSRMIEDLDKKISVVQRDVFFSTFGYFQDDGVKKVVREIFRRGSLIRRNWHIIYTIEDDCVSDEKGDPVNYVKLKATGQFRIENLSTIPASYDLSLGLPNPLVSALKNVTRVDSFLVDEEEKCTVESEREFRLQMNDEKNTMPKYTCGTIDIPASAFVEISIQYVMAKEVEDTEIVSSLTPSDGLEITVFDKGQGSRWVFASAVSMSQMRETQSNPSDGRFVWKHQGWLLPSQGAKLWWKRRTADSIDTERLQ